ncbi:MAG: sigma-70 family RNA polymerase sigma factor [Candidatus Sulfotelmatobacter sp.]
MPLTPSPRNDYVAMSQQVGRDQALPRAEESVTVLLAKWRGGSDEALHALIPLVYQELHVLAHHYLRAERPGHTLQSTALVHEAYLRLVDQSPLQIQNRAHFVGIAAKLMRQILVDYARSRRAAKRGPECRVELDESFDVPQKQGVDVIALDDALLELSRRDAQQVRIVEMRFFGGLTVEQIAEALDVSAATVKRDWSMAKAWLTREMQRGEGGKNQAMGEG